MLTSIISIPILAILIISSLWKKSIIYSKYVALFSSMLNLVIVIVLFFLFNFSSNELQFPEEDMNMQIFNIHLGIDTISLYFILLTAIIIPIALVSNWDSIKKNTKSYLIMILLYWQHLVFLFILLVKTMIFL
jgi:NADH-ubiquinone oxidoreductase chain 4